MAPARLAVDERMDMERVQVSQAAGYPRKRDGPLRHCGGRAEIV